MDEKLSIRSYKDLVVWQLSMDLAVAAYSLTGSFPKAELYGMTSQIRRSAASVPANIAEGYGRDNKGNYIQMLRISQGSLKELESHLILAARVRLTDEKAVDPILLDCDRIGRMIHGLIRALENSP